MNTRFQSWQGHYAFQQKFGASLTDPSKEAVNFYDKTYKQRVCCQYSRLQQLQIDQEKNNLRCRNESIQKFIIFP